NYGGGIYEGWFGIPITGLDNRRSLAAAASVDTNMTANVQTAPDMSSGRFAHTATLLASGRVLIAGGYNFDLGYIAGVELYDPDANVWTARLSLPAQPEVDRTFAGNGFFVTANHAPGPPTTGGIFTQSWGTRRIVALGNGRLLALADRGSVTRSYATS